MPQRPNAVAVPTALHVNFERLRTDDPDLAEWMIVQVGIANERADREHASMLTATKQALDHRSARDDAEARSRTETHWLHGKVTRQKARIGALVDQLGSMRDDRDRWRGEAARLEAELAGLRDGLQARRPAPKRRTAAKRAAK